jgi:hypothetical protein
MWSRPQCSSSGVSFKESAGNKIEFKHFTSDYLNYRRKRRKITYTACPEREIARLKEPDTISSC